MKIRIISAVAAVTILVVLSSAAFAELTAYQIAKKAADMDKTKTKTATLTMTVITEKGNKRTYKFKLWQKETPKGTQKLVRFLEPADSNGTGLLTQERKGAEDLQWLFLPSRKASRQIAAADRSEQFMGSDLFMEDMGTLNPDNFDHKLLEKTNFDGAECYVIESTPKPTYNSAYGKTKIWVDQQTFATRKIELYNKSGTLWKTAHNTSIEQISGVWTYRNLEMIKAGAKVGKTTLDLADIQYNTDIPDRYFTKEFLESY